MGNTVSRPEHRGTPRLIALMVCAVLVLLIGVYLAPTPASADAGTDAAQAAKTQIYQGKYDDALIALAAIKANYPSVAAEAQRLTGVCYQRMGDYPKAIQAFNDLIANYPDTQAVQQAYFWLGDCYQSLEDGGRAAANYEKQLTEYPKNERTWETRLKLGEMYTWMNRYNDAQAEFNKVLASNPERAARIGWFLGKFFRAQQKYAEAIVALESQIAAVPGSLPNGDDWYLKAAKYDLADCYRKNDDPRKAIEVYSSLATQYYAAPAKLKMGEIASRDLQDPARGRAFLETIPQDYPTYDNMLNVYEELAYTYYAEGNYLQAAGLYEQALACKGTDGWRPFILFMTGDCYARVDETIKARDAWGQLIKQYPTNDWAGIATERVAGLPAN